MGCGLLRRGGVTWERWLSSVEDSLRRGLAVSSQWLRWVEFCPSRRCWSPDSSTPVNLCRWSRWSRLDEIIRMSPNPIWCYQKGEIWTEIDMGRGTRTSLVAQTVKRLSTMWETWVQSLGWEDPLEKEMAIHSSTIAWKISWTEEPGRLQSMGSQRVGHDWVTSHSHSECHIIGIMWYVAFSYHLALCISGSSVSFCGLIAHFSLALNDILLYGVP